MSNCWPGNEMFEKHFYNIVLLYNSYGLIHVLSDAISASYSNPYTATTIG